mmetsp:Transcript_30523/g.61519  ORF Transcript_30523/g.61519 Transcript_30523/m.61519 type:complete len:519 (+) Transcript_30523:3360-4916(+)
MLKNDKKNLLKISNFEEDIKKKREGIIHDTRKLNREESIMKKRKEKIELIEKNSLVYSVVNRLSELKEKLISKNPIKKLEATVEIRKMVSIENDPPIEEILNSGVLPIFVSFLKDHTEVQLQFEAAWIITNIASGSSEQTLVLIQNEVVEILINLLESKNDNVKEQSIWALGNIAGDSLECQNLVLKKGILNPLLEQIKTSNRISFLRNCVWTLSNLCRNKPGPDLNETKLILSVLTKLIFSEDNEILTDLCWTLSYLSDDSPERIQILISSGIVKRLTELLMHRDLSIQTSSLRAIGNIVTGNDTQTQVIINCSAIPCLLTLLNSPKKAIKKECCWTISNITAGNPSQIQAVIDGNIIPSLINILKNSELEIRKEAAWAISNATSGGTPNQIDYLVKKGCIQPMIQLMDCLDFRVVRVILEGLENILEIGNQKVDKDFVNEYARHIEQVGGLEKLEELQQHSNNQIYEYAVKLLEKFFGAEEESEESLEISESALKIEKCPLKKEQIPDCFFGFSKK